MVIVFYFILCSSGSCKIVSYIVTGIYQGSFKECEAGALYNLASVYHCRAKTIIHASEPLDKSGLLTASDMTATSQLQAAINCYL